MGKRVFLFVLDGFGVGECEDSWTFKDEGSNTFQNVNDIVPLKMPFLSSIGLKNIDGLKFKKTKVLGTYGKLRELSKGKDTTTGHFEMMGIISKMAMPTFPNGFPKNIVEELEKAFGTKILGNVVASGTQIIQELGEEHLKTGYPIVYTSADSVLQIATHTDIVPLEKLYEYCAKAREIMHGENAVGRVIARPFYGSVGHFERNNEGRKDFSVIPDKNNTMKRLFDAGINVISVGKISEIFAEQSITEKHLNHNNHDAMIETLKIQKSLDDGFVFINFVDTDMLFGHRNNVLGYAQSLEETDTFLYEFAKNMTDDDILIVTGDHGNDPTTPSTDHSREFVPFVLYGKHVKENNNLGTLDGFDNVGQLIESYLLNKKTKIGDIVLK